MKSGSILFTAIALYCSILFLVRCSSEPVEEYSVDAFMNALKVDSMDTTTHVNVCGIIEASWDSILVVKPYAKVSGEAVLRNLENSSSIKPKIEDIRYTESYSYLIFIKKNKAIGISKTSNIPIYFGSLPSIDDSSPSTAVLSKADCAKLYRRKRGSAYIYLK